MTLARRALLLLFAPTLLFVSCVGRDSPTGVAGTATLDLVLQPALIPSAADGSALPVNRVRAVVTRTSDSSVLSDVRITVSPTDASWTLDVPVPVSAGATEVVVLLYLIHVASDGRESVQFSGRSQPLLVSAGTLVRNLDVDLVRGPPSNLSVTNVSITQAPDTLEVGESGPLRASVTVTSAVVPTVYWTTLAPGILGVVDTVATGLAVGVADVVASAGAHADTAAVVVRVPRVASVLVSPDSADVQVRSTRQYTAVTRSRSGGVLTGRAVLWETLDSALATVDQAGVVTGLAPGVTRVRATSEGVSDDAVVRVTAAPAGGAGTITWTAGSGLWSNAANWDLGRIPQPSDTVRLPPSAGPVTLDMHTAVERLVIGTGATLLVASDRLFEARSLLNGGSLHVSSGGGLTLLHPTRLDFVQAGSLIVESGAGLSFGANVQVEYRSNGLTGSGVVQFRPDSKLVLLTNLSFDGPTLGFTDATLEVDDTEDVIVGPNSVMTLASFADTTRVAAEVHNQGVVTVQGPAVALDADFFNEPGGYLLVLGGTPATGLGTRSVDNSGTIVVGGGGDVRFGPGAGPYQVYNHRGGSLQVSFGGTATLDGVLVNEGEILAVGSTVLARRTAAGADTTALHVNDGTITLAPGADLDIVLGGASPSFTNSGTIHVDTGATLAVTNVASPAGAIVNAGSGVLRGSGIVDVRAGVPTGVNHGTIAPGLSPGVLTWMGSVPMGPTGRIEIEIEGPTLGTGHDRLDVSADLVLNGNGTLEITTPFFTPSVGDRFAVLTFRSRIGNFANVSLPQFAGVTLDTVWAEAGSVDTLYIVASGAGAGGGVNGWIAGQSGSWSDGGNWSLGRAPLPGDTVLLTQGLDYAVTLDVNAIVAKIVVGGTSDLITLNVGDRTLTVTGTGPGAELDILPLGWLRIGNGTLVVQDVVNRGVVSSTGTATLSAQTVVNDGSWLVPSGVQLLGAATGATVETFGTISIDASAAVVLSTDSDLIYSSGTIQGAGLLSLLTGSNLRLEQDLVLDQLALGLQDGSVVRTGAERVTVGPAATLQLYSVNGRTAVTGVLVVEGNLYASGPQVFVGDSLYVESTGVVVVDGGAADTDFETEAVENAGNIVLLGAGDVAFGTHDVLHRIANRAGGTVDVFSGGARYLVGEVINEGTLTLWTRAVLWRTDAFGTYMNAAHVNTGSIELFGVDSGLDVYLGGAASSFTNSGAITLGDPTSSLGIVNVSGTDGRFENAAEGSVTGDGTVRITGLPTVINDGTIAPGLSPGALSWEGPLDLGATGVIAIELEGTLPGVEYDQLRVAGNLGLGGNGTLDVTVPFTPTDGDRFAVLTFAGRSGTFGSVVLPTIRGITLDTVWAEAGSVDTLFVVASRAPTSVGGVWTANAGDAVTFIDVGQDTVATVQCTTAQSPCSEPRNPAVNSSGTLVAVPMRFSDKVMLIDVGQGGFSTEITDASFAEPYAAAFTERDDEIWIVNKVTGSSGSTTPGSVTIIDVATRSVVGSVDTLLFSSPEGIAIANGKAYVANRGNSTVTVVDVATRTALQNVGVTGAPRFAVATPDGQFVYVSVDDTTVYKISTATDQIVSTVTVGGSARNLAAHPDGTRIYAALLRSNSVDVIDVATGAVSTITFSGAFGVYGVAVLRDGSMGFVTDESRNLIYAFDPATGSEIVGGIYPVATGSTPRGIAAH